MDDFLFLSDPPAPPSSQISAFSSPAIVAASTGQQEKVAATGGQAPSLSAVLSAFFILAMGAASVGLDPPCPTLVAAALHQVTHSTFLFSPLGLWLFCQC